MIEHILTCNNLKCRKDVGVRALVTTCSHIFCLDCARRSGLPDHVAIRGGNCPACGSPLSKPDDAIIANLNPSEDCKTSLLSGLSPNIIMECAGRALSFWAYQTTQEIYYQQYLYKTVAEKFSALGIRMEQTTSSAGVEIERLQHKLHCAASELESLRRKNEEFAQAYKEKSRKLVQTQELYDKVKRKAEMGHIQQAASEAVDSTFYGPPRPRSTVPQEYGFRSGFGAFGRGGTLDTEGLNQGISDLSQGIPQSNPCHAGMQNDYWAHRHADAQGIFPTGVDEHSRPYHAPFPRKTGLPNRFTSTPLPFHANHRRYSGPQSPGFTQPRGGFSGIGLSSGLKVSQSMGSAGLGPSGGNH
ncbi:hypothetical protein CDD82_4469 [Ophiocordyceps australis]|uniref:RING-type domain-containing protein n=1 Tax=Ophiocordyceps australis TaxID=1399860 RepID=A0A2C5Z7M5_9HYPO|nr:hypothetical protein CDD82_4469 [Ophiocordyceps australis]